MNCGIAMVKVELATQDEIKNKDRLNTDSVRTDTTACIGPVKTLSSNQPDSKEFMIQAGIFRLKNSAYNLEKYLNRNKVPGVFVLKFNFKGQVAYKVTIGPLYTFEKETTLRLLKAKHIKGIVSKIITIKHKHKRLAHND